MIRKVHRWQITGWTTCGREIVKVTTNMGRYLDDGVTCLSCQRAKSRMGLLWDDWNGQCDGAPDRRTPAEVAEAERLRVERERCFVYAARARRRADAGGQA